MRYCDLLMEGGDSTLPERLEPVDLGRWERLSYFLANSKPPDEAAVGALEAETNALQDLELTIPSALLFPHLAAHLNRLADVLNGTVTLKLRQRLIMTAGSAASTSGWIAWDNGHSDSAQRLHRIASDASREANYPLLMAFHLGDMSYIPSSRGDARRAEQMLAQALGHVNPIDFPRVFAWLEARRAEELARLGDKAALQLLESSLNHFATTPNSDASWGRFLTSARMDVFALNVYLHLGRHQEAEPLARRVMESVSVTSPLRPVILADVAAAYLKSGDFAQGTEIADQAYRAAAKVHSRWALSRLNNLHQMFHDS